MAKSDLHIELARRALVWLETKATGRGIKGCEEVILDDGYVVDCAALSGLQMAHERNFVGRHKERGFDEAADDYAFLFESKVSRSDFFNTFKRGNHRGDRMQPKGNFHFVVTQRGLLKPEEVPGFWGLLEQSGAGLRVAKMPAYQPLETVKLYELGYLILRSIKYGKFSIYEAEIKQYRQEQISIL